MDGAIQRSSAEVTLHEPAVAGYDFFQAAVLKRAADEGAGGQLAVSQILAAEIDLRILLMAVLKHESPPFSQFHYSTGLSRTCVQLTLNLAPRYI